MPKVVVIGGGWAGSGAAISAKKAGADVVLLERTDMLLGTGLVGGIMRNNGRFTAAEEMIALGGGDLFQICDRNARHKDVNFPGHNHAILYDIVKTHGDVLRYLTQLGVEIVFRARVKEVNMENIKLLADYYHMSVENEDIDVLLETGNYIKHVHLSCKRGRCFPGLFPEDSIKSFFRCLYRIGYSDRISIEAFTDNFRQDAAKALRFLKEEIKNSKKAI